MICLSKEEHENRNQFNELPSGLLKPSPDNKEVWVDEKWREWKKYSDPQSAYHQPYNYRWLPVRAFIQGYLGNIPFLGYLRVPVWKFVSKNPSNDYYSEVCANRYTGRLVMDQRIIGTMNYSTDPDEHDKWDVKPHNIYGSGYKHVVKGVLIPNTNDSAVAEEGHVIIHPDALTT